MRKAFLIFPLVSLLLFLGGASLKAQKEGFNRLYHLPSASDNLGVQPLELDSSYLILGAVDTNMLTQMGRSLILYELDRGGDTIRTSRVVEGWPGNYWQGPFEGLVHAPDSGFYLVGAYEDSSSNSEALLFRIGEDLDTLWTRSYGASDTLFEKFSSIEVLPSGNLIVTGQKGNPGYYRNNAWVLKMDPLGNVIWKRQIGNDKDQGFSLASLQRARDGGFITAGSITRSATGGKKFASGLIMKLDSMGQKEWRRDFMGDYGYWLSSVHQTSDSTFMAGGGRATDANLGKPYNQIGVLRKYDTGGTMQWEKEYYPDSTAPHDQTYGFVKRMEKGEDGSLIFGGWKFLSPTPDPDSSYEGWVYKTDPSGDLLWMRGFRYHDIGEQILWNLREVEQKRILAVGSASHPDTTYGRQSLWVLKLDSMGCVRRGCAVSLEEGKKLTSGFRIRPNPNDGRFQVLSEQKRGTYQGTLRVFDQKGRTLLKRSLRGTYPFRERIRLPEGASGLHFVEWRDRNGRYVRKMMVR